MPWGACHVDRNRPEYHIIPYQPLLQEIWQTNKGKQYQLSLFQEYIGSASRAIFLGKGGYPSIYNIKICKCPYVQVEGMETSQIPLITMKYGFESGLLRECPGERRFHVSHDKKKCRSFHVILIVE